MYICTFTASTICQKYQCPNESKCKICNATGLPYCEYSCTINNGGCGAEALCTEVSISSDDSQECITTGIKCKSIYRK